MDNFLRDLKKVYGMLQDDESRDIYLNRLNYMVTGDFEYIHRIASAYLPQIPRWDGSAITDAFMKLPGNRDFVLYGAGQHGARLLPYCKGNKRFVGFCSKTKEKQKNGYLGYPTMSPEELLARRDLNVIVSTSIAKGEIMQVLMDGGYPSELIFDESDFLNKAPAVLDSEQYFSPSFMKYEDNEVFVDAGCFDLGSSLKLKEYAKLKKCTHLSRIRQITSAAWRERLRQILKKQKSSHTVHGVHEQRSLSMRQMMAVPVFLRKRRVLFILMLCLLTKLSPLMIKSHLSKWMWKARNWNR